MNNYKKKIKTPNSNEVGICILEKKKKRRTYKI